MLNTTLPNLTIYGARRQAYRSTLSHWIWLLSVAGASVLLAAVMFRSGPSLAIIGWLLLLAGAVAIVREPRHGLYLSLFLSLQGDQSLTPWYPFTKNLSSAESILFISDALVLSPLEIYLGLTIISWLIREQLARRLRVQTGSLVWLTGIFSLFVMSGIVYGLARGGNATATFWEARTLLYLLPLTLLVTNLIQTPAQANYLLWAFAAGMVIEGFWGTYHYFVVLNGELNVQAITEHASAIQMNAFFILLAAAWIYRGSPLKRGLLPALAPFVIITYLATQRRAAFAALAVALLFLLIILYQQRRTAFYLIAPVLLAGSLLYTATFWNSNSALGLPAQTVKAYVAPDTLNDKERRSSLYRDIENFNLRYTIRSAPLMGLGFGQKFYRPLALPDISSFIWWEYIPHNSLLWIWIKTGVGGFVSLLLLFGLAIARGARFLRDLPRPELGPLMLVATLYLVMHFIFAYVDIAWTAQSTLVLGVMLGLLNNTDSLSRDSAPAAPARRQSTRS